MLKFLIKFCLAVIFMTFSAAAQNLVDTTALEDNLQIDTVSSDVSVLQLEAFVDGIVESARSQHRIPGVTVSIVRGDSVLLSKGYGYADLQNEIKVDADETKFRIGSVSKTFVWTAAMILVDRGQLDLDVNVNEYLKGVTIPDTFDDPVTMAHLMAHRAGFEETMTIAMYPDGEVYDFDEVLQESMPTRVFAPGERTSYSNWGTGLATKVVEDVSGQPFDVFLKEEILDPLRIEEVSLYGRRADPEDIKQHVALGYQTLGGGVGLYDTAHMGPFWSVGAMGISASGMARWSRFHLNGGELDGVRLLSEDSYARMRERSFQDRPNSADMANGFMEILYGDYVFYGHGGSTSDFLTNWMLIPDLDLGIFVSQNSGSTYHLIYSLPTLIVDLLEDSFVKQTFIVTDPENISSLDPDIDLSQYAGNYHSNRQSFTTFEKTFTMYNTISVSPDGSGGLAIYNGIDESDTLFYPLAGAPDVFVNDKHSRLHFGRDASGNVTYLTGAYGTGTFERIDYLENAAALNLCILIATILSLTMLIGAWRRYGTDVQQTKIGLHLGRVNLILPLSVFLLLVSIEVVNNIAPVSNEAQMAFDYPPFQYRFVRTAGFIVFLSAALSVILSYFVWRSSGWTIWRRVHHTLFALSLLFLTLQIAFWNVIFAPVV